MSAADADVVAGSGGAERMRSAKRFKKLLLEERPELTPEECIPLKHKCYATGDGRYCLRYEVCCKKGLILCPEDP